MSKYYPLQQFLQQSAKDEVTLSFDEVEHLLGSGLPDSTYKYRAWWSNNDQTHPQATAWLEAGWKVDTVDQGRKWVRFRRLES